MQSSCKPRAILMQISCEFASDFFEKRLHYCTTIAPPKSCKTPASDEKPTPDLMCQFDLTPFCILPTSPNVFSLVVCLHVLFDLSVLSKL